MSPITIRCVGSTLLSAALIAALWVPSPSPEGRVPQPVSQIPSAEAAPSWATCVFPISETLRQPDTEYRSTLPSRGLATASMVRPTVVLSSYEMPHNQTGPELTNLTIALRALDRVMIPPHSELSFNAVVGARMEEKGYMAGLMFSSGRVVRGVGGGVCVASTVLYNAALNAGFPILERWMHSGPTSYAEATRDAAVVYGHKDLRVKNNLDDAVWVRCIVDEEVVRVSLLTLHRPPYAVSLREEGPGYIPSPLTLEETDGEGPEVLAEGSPGCDRTLIREFRRNGKLVRQETICRDIRKPVMRIVGLPRQLAGSDMLEIPPDLGGSAMPEPHLPPQKVEPAHRPIQVEPRPSL